MAELTTLPEDLLLPLSAGDPAALEILIGAYYAILCRFAEKYLPDASLAEDVVQESFIKLWKSGKSFATTGALKAYLYTITRNGCLDLVRSRSRLHNRHQQVAADHELATEPILSAIIRAESLAMIYQVVNDMPEKMQQVFYLSYEEGLSVSEIAVQLGMNLKAVKKQKYKALVALRSRFSNRQQPLLVLLGALLLIGDRHS